MSTGLDWAAFLDVLVGLGVFLAGVGVLVAMLSLGRVLRRLNKTLDTVDEQVSALGKPVSETLSHVGGIADTADQTLARLTGVVNSLEQIAGSLAQTAKLTQEAVSPAIVNVGAALGGVSAGLRRLIRGEKQTGENA